MSLASKRTIILTRLEQPSLTNYTRTGDIFDRRTALRFYRSSAAKNTPSPAGKHNAAEFQAARDNTVLRVSERRGAIHAAYFSVPFSANARTRRFCRCSDLSTVSFARPPRPTAFHASRVSYPARRQPRRCCSVFATRAALDNRRRTTGWQRSNFSGIRADGRDCSTPQLGTHYRSVRNSVLEYCF